MVASAEKLWRKIAITRTARATPRSASNVVDATRAFADRDFADSSGFFRLASDSVLAHNPPDNVVVYEAESINRSGHAIITLSILSPQVQRYGVVRQIHFRTGDPHVF